MKVEKVNPTHFSLTYKMDEMYTELNLGLQLRPKTQSSCLAGKPLVGLFQNATVLLYQQKLSLVQHIISVPDTPVT